MCGITGLFEVDSKNIRKDKENTLRAMMSSIHHRGPDDSGIYIDDHISLGHQRLSILDLSHSGHQPMSTLDDKYTIIFNGEIYNHLDIRKDLINLGYVYKGTSDTETILYGYTQWGTDILKRLNGIFALAIYDKQLKQLIIARDRFGVKPLYYYKTEKGVIFGSEIKSLLKTNLITPTINYSSLHEFLFYGYALEEKTMYEGIKKLLPGNYAIISKEKIIFKSFWQHEDIIQNNNITEKNAIIGTRTLLEKAVQKQLISDVPVGVFLSGGIDSSSITAFATRHYGGKIKSYSAGFDFNKKNNELNSAKKIANYYQTEHQELMIKGGDLPLIIESLIKSHDEPFSDAANIPLFLLTEQVKGKCKVILQGDGGDEMFGGYRRYHILKKYGFYKSFFNIANLFSPIIPNSRIVESLNRFSSLLSQKQEAKLFALLLTTESEERNPGQLLNTNYQNLLLKHNPFDYYYKLTKRFSQLPDLAQKMLWIDTLIILPDQFLEKVDKSTMANSVEVRVPFLENDLASFAMQLPSSLKLKNGVKKYILKKALEGIVPNEVLYGPKKGFGVPYQNWLKGPLYPFMMETIKSDYIIKLGLFNYVIIDKLIKEHRGGIKDHGFILWKLLNLCLWLQIYKVNIKYEEN